MQHPLSSSVWGFMNSKKCIILLTGTTCVGKSTVLETVKELLKNQQINQKKEILENIISKIKALIKPDIIRKIEPDTEALLEAEGFICRPGPKLIIDEKIITLIRQAILECHQIKIKYYNKNTGKISINTLNS